MREINTQGEPRGDKFKVSGDQLEAAKESVFPPMKLASISSSCSSSAIFTIEDMEKNIEIAFIFASSSQAARIRSSMLKLTVTNSLYMDFK